MGLKRVSWVRRYQGQCRALRPLGHQGYRLRNYKKDPPLCSGYTRYPANHHHGAPCQAPPRSHQTNRTPKDANADDNGHHYAQRHRTQARYRRNRLTEPKPKHKSNPSHRPEPLTLDS